MKIALIGAFDRYNYGDLLMPIVVEAFLEKYYGNLKFEYVYCAQKQKQMGYAGGVDTIEMNDLYNGNQNVDAIIIVGGEVLSANYYEMYMNVQDNKMKILGFKILHRTLKKTTNKICRSLLDGKTCKPWIVDSKICNKIIYNTIGGNVFYDNVISDNDQKELKKNFENSSYIAIRDNKSLESNRNLLPSHTKFYPDSVLIMSKLFSEEDIEDKMTHAFKYEMKKYTNYFVLQVNKSIGMDLIDKLASEIDMLKEKLNIDCVLIPIGYAQGHEDQIPLTLIASKCKSNPYIPEFNNIYDTIYAIKNSKMYIGSSLHGAITAISYSVQHSALTEKSRKLITFLETWDTTKYKYCEVDSFAESVEKMLNDEEDKKHVSIKSKELVSLVEENFNNIADLLK